VHKSNELENLIVIEAFNTKTNHNMLL